MECSNRNEESSLVGNAAPILANYRYVIENLVANTLENAPQMLDTPTSHRSGLLARLVGGSGIRQQNITDCRKMFSSDSLPSPPSDEQQLLFRIETEAAKLEAEVRAERTAILRLQIETERAELDARKAAAAEALATSRHRIRELTRGTPSPTSPRSPRRATSSPRVRSPSPPPTLVELAHCPEKVAELDAAAPHSSTAPPHRPR